jgi:hypothetical protein
MANATSAAHRLNLPKHSYQSLQPPTASNESDSLSFDWAEGVRNLGNSADNIEDTRSEEVIVLLPSVELENTSLFDLDARDAAAEAAERMSQPTTESAEENSQVNNDGGVLDTHTERAYLHCYTAASISLLCLSVTSFVLPSISTYPPERSAVQTLGYTAGVISLLSGLAAGASVVAAYTGSGYLHR